jgi:MFS transporter, OFA family, oxalate/formate antiporter
VGAVKGQKRATFEMRIVPRSPRHRAHPCFTFSLMKSFYGWWLLAGLFIAYVVTNGVILNTLPIFYPELIKTFGWTQAQVTRPAQLLFLVVAMSSPFAGILLDRYDAKRMMLIGGGLILAAFAWYTRVNSLGEMLGVYVLYSVGITLGGILPSMRILTRWFVKKRGLAVGILLVGSSLGGAIFNQVAGGAIAAYGWRTALLILGLIATALVILPVLFLVKNTPEEIGLLPDGATDSGSRSVSAQAEAPGAGFKAAVASPTFYLLLLVTGAMWFCIVGVIQHQALFFKDLQTTIASKDVLSLFFLSSILGKLLFGRLSDRFSKKTIMMAAVLNLAAGAGLLNLVPNAPQTLLWPYAIVFGIGFSGTFTMIQLLVAEYYAGPSYGKILGLVTMVDTLAGVLGILILGQMRTASGTYTTAFQLLFAVSVVAALCVPLLKKPVYVR